MNPADYRTLLWVLLYYSITLSSYVYGNLFYIPILCYFSFACATIVHNTIHCSVFENIVFNELFEILLSISYGHPVSSFIPGHNKSHHVYTQTNKDAMRTSKLRYNWNLLNLLLFQQTVAPNILLNDIKYILSKKGTYFYKKAITEFRLVLFVNILLMVYDIKKFFLFFYIPHLFAQWAIVSINMLQHDGCDDGNGINSARNFTGSIINYLTFNNGYHTIHHMNPKLHWSKLPEMHNKIVAPFNHKNLNQSNMLTYIFKHFIYPANRIDYLGNPVIVDYTEDESWFDDSNIQTIKKYEINDTKKYSYKKYTIFSEFINCMIFN